MEGKQPCTLAVDEDDDRRGVLVEQLGERPEVGPFRHDEPLVKRDADRNHFAQAQGPAGEQRHALGLRQLGLVDEHVALSLDPVEILGLGPTGLSGPPKLAGQKHAGPIALMLVRPPRVQVDAHHSGMGRWQTLQTRELRGDVIVRSGHVVVLLGLALAVSRDSGASRMPCGETEPRSRRAREAARRRGRLD